MNATRLAAARAAQPPDRSADDGTVRQGAFRVAPIRLIQDHTFRTLFAYLHPTDRAVVVGQGSHQDYLSVRSYECGNPTGDDQAVITPIYTPQLYDDYNLPIDGSPLGQELQNIDVTPNNSASIGVQGKSGVPVPFVNKVVPGRGIKPTPYGQYAYKDPPKDSLFLATPPQGKNAPGTVYQQPSTNSGKGDRVVNRPKLDIYLGDGLTWAEEDNDGFTPLKIKLGRGLSFGPADPGDENRKPLQADLAGGGSSLRLAAGAAIIIDPPTPPLLATTTAQSTPGSVDAGDHSYAAYFTTTSGKRSGLSAALVVENTTDHGQGLVTIAAYASPPASINGLVLMRTKATGADTTTFFQLHTFTRSDVIGGISYTDNTADVGLGAPFAGGDPSVVSVELAADSDGANISGLVENGGDDSNGLAIDPYSPNALAVVAGPGIRVTPPPPPAAPTVAIQAGAGLGMGAYEWVVTYQYDLAGTTIETNPSIATSGTTTTGNQQALITALAPPAISGMTIIGTGVYRNALGSSALQLVTVVAGSGALGYTDSTADGGLSGASPHQKNRVEIDLATSVFGGVSTNVSGLVDNAGDDNNGLQVNIDGVTITRNPLGQLVSSGSGGGISLATQVRLTAPWSTSAGNISWNTEETPIGTSMWDGATKITAPADGTYLVSFHAHSVSDSLDFGSGVYRIDVGAVITKNGSNIIPTQTNQTYGLWTTSYGTSSETTLSSQYMLPLTTGDYLEVNCSQSVAPVGAVGTGLQAANFSLIKLA